MEQLGQVQTPTGHPLFVRQPRLEDAAQFLELYGTVPVHQIGDVKHALVEERARIERHLSDPHAKHGFGLFVLVNEATDEIVGRTGIKHSVAPTAGEWEIDYMLRVDYRGQGIGHTIAAWTMGQVENVWSVDHVLGHVAVDNIPSIRILDRLGFRRFGEVELPDFPEMGVLYRYVWQRSESR